MKGLLVTVATLLIWSGLLTGCATTQLETQAKMTRTISLSPEYLEDKRVLLRVTGTEASVLELEEPLRTALVERGVTLVEKEGEANIALHVNSLFADNLKEAANYSAAATGGLVGGALSKASGNSSGDSILLGVGIALAMGVSDRVMADETYRAVVDVTFRMKPENADEWTKKEQSRVIAEAIRMGLDVDEAKPIMEEKVVYQIAEILR